MAAVDAAVRRSPMPRLPEPLVCRVRLEEALAAGVHADLTLISAPPGAGKTTMLTGWLAHANDRTLAWRTVERRDNVAGRFARSVVLALVEVDAIGREVVRHGGRGVELLEVALRELDRRAEPVLLVLDDVHELTANEALTCLSYLVDHAPPALNIVLSTRADPPLRLGRLRASGRMCEIRNASLLFRLSEATELFAAHGLHLGSGEVRAIHELTEGWAGGLRLVAYALERGGDAHRFVTDRGPAEAAVSDYLLNEVIARQPPSVQQFLLRTSVVDELTPELATVLTGDPAAGALLEQLDRRGVFLAQIREDRTYRYHSLLLALLRALLRQQDPALHDELH